MTKLEQLIEQLCPDGVEYKTLGEIATISRGGSFQKKHFVDSGVPCIHYGQIYTRYGLFAHEALTYISDEVAVKQRFAQPNDIVMAVTSENIEDVCKCVVWLGDTPVAVSGHSAIIHHTQNAKYLAYYFHSSMFFTQKRKIAQGTKVIEVSPDKLNRVKVPVPPLEVQDEIVRILDNFTELTAGLTAELTARKKQYDYYKERVFESFIRDDTQYIPINKFAIVKDGTHDSPKQKQEGKYLITSKNIKNGKVNFNGAYLISIEDYNSINQRSKVDKWDLLFTMIGTVGEVGIVFDEPDYAIKNVGLIKTNNETASRFLYHFLTSKSVKKYVADNKSKGSQVFLALGKLRNIPIPVFTFSEQQQIVEILDRFDKLCNDISEGLPAEIEARQKQYEYYRDKLLTFKEAE